MTDKAYEWVRREDETPRAYEAFRIYLNMGAERSIPKVAEQVGKSRQLIAGWSRDYDWVERVRARDKFMVEAETDGMANQLATVREKHIVLADRLLDHLETRLQDFMEKRQDPTVRWTQAFTAAIKAHQGAFLMKDEAKTDQLIYTAQALIERLERAEAGERP